MSLRHFLRRSSALGSLVAFAIAHTPRAGAQGSSESGQAKRLASVVAVAVEEYGKGVDSRGALVSQDEYTETIGFLDDARQIAQRLTGPYAVEAIPASQSLVEAFSLSLAVVVLFSVSYWLISKVEAAKWQRFIREKVTGALEDGVRIPMRPFFAVTSLLLYYMAFVFAGKAVRELQEANLVPNTYVPHVPHWNTFGIFPSAQTLMVRGILIALFIFAPLKTFLSRSDEPTPAERAASKVPAA